MSVLSLAAAEALLRRAAENAAEKFKRPICGAICDSAGALLVFIRQDGAPLRSIRISQNKAYTAARMGVTTKAFHERLQRDQIAVRDFCDDDFTALAGGAPLRNSAGAIVGAAGISGLALNEDQEIADLLAQSVNEVS